MMDAYRNRKALESRSLADDERITFLETQLKEAKYISEDADRKYDEVTADNHWLTLYCIVVDDYDDDDESSSSNDAFIFMAQNKPSWVALTAK